MIWCAVSGPPVGQQMKSPAEVCEYPDSGKVGAYGREGSKVRHLTETSAAVDYWKGEI